MGTLLGIRPIIYMNAEGKMLSIGKERGRANAIARLLKYVDELGDDVTKHRIIIGHTDAPDMANELADKVKEKYRYRGYNDKSHRGKPLRTQRRGNIFPFKTQRKLISLLFFV